MAVQSLPFAETIFESFEITYVYCQIFFFFLINVLQGFLASFKDAR